MESASDAATELVERARRLGPIPFSALGPHPARPEAGVDALIEWEVDAVDAWWAALGRPDPFTLVEIGAGDGSRAAAFLGRGPECLTALRYVLVEDDPRCRELQSGHIPIESPILVLGPVGAAGEDDDGDDDEMAARVAGLGPLITSLGHPPVVSGPAVLVAIGWASRLPSDRLEWRDDRWWEVRLAATGQAVAEEGTPGLRELLVPLDKERSAAADSFAGCAPRPDRARYAQLGPAVAWLASTLRVAESGWLAVVDQWTPVTAPVPPGQVPPLALDQLASVRRALEPAPLTLFSDWSVVTWRLG